MLRCFRGEFMKIALLSRVSTSKQDNENQILALTEFAAKQARGIVAQFVDTVTGSGKKSRTQFEKMMQAASRREFDLVLFWKLDRFSREGTRPVAVPATAGRLESRLAKPSRAIF